MLASVAEWERASGPDRVWWRRDAQHRLAEWRRLYREPERRAFEAAVARSKAVQPQSRAREQYETAWRIKESLR